MTGKIIVAGSLSVGLLALASGISIMPRPARAVPADSSVLTFYILPAEQGMMGPDGKHHDTFLPSSVLVKQGVPITFRFVNYDDLPHTMTTPELGLNIVIAPATPVKSDAAATRVATSEDSRDGVRPGITMYRFTPARIGEFRWHCSIMCDPWAMGASFGGPDQVGFMAGYVVVRK